MTGNTAIDALKTTVRDDYYNEHLKTKEEFKYVQNFNDMKKSCKMNIIIKIILFSLFAIIYLCHSIDTFFSGLDMPMITKRKGSILYTSNHKLFNTLHYNFMEKKSSK